MDAPNKVYKQGYLLKSPPLNVSGKTQGLKRWRKRWCVLLSDSIGKLSLFYYKNEDAFLRNKMPLGIIPAEEAFSCEGGLAVKTGSRKHKFVWTLNLARRKFLLAADSSYEMNLWVETVQNTVPHLTPVERRQSTGQWSRDAYTSDTLRSFQRVDEEKDEWSDWDEQVEEETEPFEFPPPPPPLPPVPCLSQLPIPFSASYFSNQKTS